MPRRELKVTYGSYVFAAGETKRTISGPYRLRDGPDDFEFECELVIFATTSDADFATEVAAALSAFRTPDQELKLELVDPDTPSTVEATIFSAKPTSPSRTALNVRCEIEQPDEIEGNSHRSAVFQVRVTGDRPADYSGPGGGEDHLRLDFEHEVRYSASRRRTLIVRGAYTATASALAQATYAAQIVTKVTAIQTALGSDWGTVPKGEVFTVDKNDNLCRFEREYVELFHNEASGTIDHPSIVDQELRVNAATIGGDGDPAERRLQRLLCTYTGWIDADQTKNLKALWEGTIEPWIRENIRNAAATGTVAIMVSDPQFWETENVITARVEALAATDGSLIRRLVTYDDDAEFGNLIRDYYPNNPNDDPTSPDPGQVYKVAKKLFRTVRTETERLGRIDPPDIGGGGGAQGAGIQAFLRNRFGPAFGQDLFAAFDPANLIAQRFGAGPDQNRGGQAVPGARISAGGVPIRRRETTVARTKGLGADTFTTTVKTVIETFRIIGPPPPRQGGGTTQGSPATGSQTRERGR